MASPPVIEWRAASSPYAVTTSIALTGTGYNGAIAVGNSSNAVQLRVYNNFVSANGIADATNCVIAAYDDTIHQGSAVNPATTGLYLHVQVFDYNGNSSGGDPGYYLIGGTTKHAVPVNGGTIAGASANYITVLLVVTLPTNATQGTISQGVWIEYSASA